ncbi:Phage tail protein [Streptosporangium canum]|uniref:Phage tail protein n=1 Tax=Streptosporangium canum TaxID=324952 RepID=A0A1I3LB39_9ACTN|nr:hypothetical protein [Streptosporangium canum]SFI81696.1 Phage tail protein [Streptosporangium canum]
MLFQPTVVQLRGVDGSLYTLTDEGSTGAAVLLQPGAKGLDAPAFDTKADEYPAIDGGFYRFARAPIREIFLPLTITGTTRAEMMALKRRFIASLNPKRGLISLQTIEYTQVGKSLVAETPRAITGYYVSGMEGGEGTEDGVHWAKYGLVMRTPHPYFQHTSRAIATFQVYDLVRPFVDPPEGAQPFLSVDGTTPGKGLGLSSTPIWVNDIDLENPGDVEAQPRWEIRGPLSSRLSLVRKDDDGNTVAELRLSASLTIATGEVMVIETTKGSQYIRIYPAREIGIEYDPLGGRSMWWALDIASDMWALQPGLNHISLVIDKPTGMTPEQETAWEAANQPNVVATYLPSFMGI